MITQECNIGAPLTTTC